MHIIFYDSLNVSTNTVLRRIRIEGDNGGHMSHVVIYEPCHVPISVSQCIVKKKTYNFNVKELILTFLLCLCRRATCNIHAK